MRSICPCMAGRKSLSHHRIGGRLCGKYRGLHLRWDCSVLWRRGGSVPYLLIVILISVVTDSKSLGTMLVALTLTGGCGIARIVRGQMLQLKSQEFVLAANALGVSPMKTILKHMIPNTMSLIIVAITFDIPGYIFSEAFLSYVGLGIQAPQTSWGALSTAAQQNFMFYPYQLLFPAIMIALTMLSFTLLGDGLRDALDPKQRK